MNIAEETEDTTSVQSGLSDTVQQLEENFLVQLHEFMTLQLINLQNTPVTMHSLIMFLFFLSIFAIGGKVISRVLFFRMLGNVQMDEGIRYTLMRFTNYFVMFIGVVISFQFIGIDLSGLAVIFGLLSVGIGFGLQNVTSNFIAGLILLIERPIKIGDRIIVNDMEGDVKEINDAKRHIIVASEIRMNIVRIFKEHDIEIPFPQRDINFRNIM